MRFSIRRSRWRTTAAAVHVIVGIRSSTRSRQPNIGGDDHNWRAIARGKQNRRFIGALVERFRHFSDLFLAPRRLAWPNV